MMNVGNYCTRDVIITDTDSSILEVTKLMRQHHVGSVVIVSRNNDGVRPVGIITDRDIVVEVLAKDVPMDSITIEDVMTRAPVVAREDDDLFTTMEMMRLKGIRRIPVVDSLGLLAGILTTDDLLEIIDEEVGNIVSLISHEQKQEQKKLVT